MSERAAARLAWSAAGTAVGLLALASLLASWNHDLLDLGSDYGPDHFVGLGIAVVGAVVASRRRRNPIGWILLGMALVDALRGAAAEYAIHGLGASPPAPGTAWAAWVANLALILIFPSGAIPLFLLLFPDGQVPGRRWRAVGWAILVVTAVFLVGAAVDATPIVLAQGVPAVPNPTGIPGLLLQHNAALVLLWPATLVVLGLGAASVVVRYRRSRGDERQQLKWFTYAVALLVPAILVTFPFPWGGTASNVVVVVGFGLALPVAVGVAILKYRLYDIDRLINRTVVYGLVTVVLGACYALLVLGLGQRLGGVRGQPPPLAVAVATLAVAALFGPLRRRVQDQVDRRFNRRRYDAARTIQGFSARLREEVDLDTLTAELLAVVESTIQPTRVALWLRAPQERSGRPSRFSGPA